MTDLSPAAQAVNDAAFTAYWNNETMAPNDHNIIAAAALEALADQVVPLCICGTSSTRGQTRLGVRHKILAIAAELHHD